VDAYISEQNFIHLTLTISDPHMCNFYTPYSLLFYSFLVNFSISVGPTALISEGILRQKALFLPKKCLWGSVTTFNI